MTSKTPRVPSFNILHHLQEGAMTSTTPRAPSFEILHHLQEDAMTRTTPRAPSVYILHYLLSYHGATIEMPRWTTTCPSFKTTSTHSPSLETCHQALVEAPRQGRQGIQMTFDDTPPLKNGNNDMRRSQEGRHTIKQVRLQELQGPTSANCQSLSLVLMRS